MLPLLTKLILKLFRYVKSSLGDCENKKGVQSEVEGVISLEKTERMYDC